MRDTGARIVQNRAYIIQMYGACLLISFVFIVFISPFYIVMGIYLAAVVGFAVLIIAHYVMENRKKQSQPWRTTNV